MTPLLVGLVVATTVAYLVGMYLEDTMDFIVKNATVPWITVPMVLVSGTTFYSCLVCVWLVTMLGNLSIAPVIASAILGSWIWIQVH